MKGNSDVEPSIAAPSSFYLTALGTERLLRDFISDSAVSHGLCLNEALLVLLSYGEKNRDQKQLAEAIGISTAQASGRLEQLRQRGLLQCERSEGDRRRQIWKTTKRGAAVAALIESELKTSFQAIGTDISSLLDHLAEQARLLRLISNRSAA